MEPEIEIVVKATRSLEGYNVLFANRLAIGPVEYETPRIVRCRDCLYFRDRNGICMLAVIGTAFCKDDLKQDDIDGLIAACSDGFCAWGKPREKACRNADEGAAAFADAPTIETAREPMQPPTFALGA